VAESELDAPVSHRIRLRIGTQFARATITNLEETEAPQSGVLQHWEGVAHLHMDDNRLAS
jgi:hypothetical protein